MVLAYAALGSNIDPQRRMLQAAALLRQYFPDIVFSPCFGNPAVGFDGADFINAAAGFTTRLTVPELQAALHAIEEQCGRHRADSKWAPRAMDIDLLLYGDQVCDAPLPLPRPDLLRRGYMLGPLAALAPQLLHPRTGQSMTALWGELCPQVPALRRLALDLNAS